MADIVVVGAGACGLLTAMLLAGDGHEVTVVERDPTDPPAVDDVWDGWDRRGVNQFHQPHFLLSRFLTEVRVHLPQVEPAMRAAGCHELNFFGPFREALAEPERFDTLTARRPVIEAALVAAAAATPRVSIRRGVAISGVLTGTPSRPGIPHVTGVRTEDGEELRADLVIAATGRRSPIGRWLEEAGGRAPAVEAEDSGFVYYGGYVASPDGEQPVGGPTLMAYGSIELLALPADRGTVGVGIITASGDAALRGLRDESTWRRVLARLPHAAPVVDLPLISAVRPMAGIEDVRRRFLVDGSVVATGIVPVADGWAATNPTLGRGISLGLLHALILRDLVETSLDDPLAFATEFAERTDDELGPWYETTLWQDRHTLAETVAAAGLGPAPSDDAWRTFRRLSGSFSNDFDLAVAWASCSAALDKPPTSLLDDEAVLAKLETMPSDPDDHGGPSRDELVALVAG